MRRLFFMGCLLIGCLQAGAKMPDAWLASSNANLIDSKIERMLHRITKQDHASDRERLLIIFKKTQKEFLHRFRPMADLDELAAGDYNCLTATTLFAEILTRAGYKFKVFETNYHIFLLTSTSEGEVLLETTDRYAGFITSPVEIQARIRSYRMQDAPVADDRLTAYQYNFDVFGEIDMTELSGLLYFNQAVKAYNESEWKLCSERLMLAERHSDSPRIAALASVLAYTISIKGVEESEKQLILRNLSQFVGSRPVASR